MRRQGGSNAPDHEQIRAEPATHAFGRRPRVARSNEEHAVIPFVHWMPRLRDWDLSVWDDVRAAQREEAARWERTRRAPPRAAAVFRGGVYRMSVYSRDWRARGVRRSELTADSWRCCGRMALLRVKEEEAAAAVRLATPRPPVSPLRPAPCVRCCTRNAVRPRRLHTVRCTPRRPMVRARSRYSTSISRGASTVAGRAASA